MRKNESKQSLLTDSLGGSINLKRIKNKSKYDAHNSNHNSSSSDMYREPKEINQNLNEVFEYFNK